MLVPPIFYVILNSVIIFLLTQFALELSALKKNCIMTGEEGCCRTQGKDFLVSHRFSLILVLL